MRRLLGWPVRAYRSRISVQLIVSSVLVVILTVVLIEAAIIGLVLWQAEPPGGVEIIDETLGEQSTVAAERVEATGIPEHLANGGDLTTADQAQLDTLIRSFIDDGLPTVTSGPPAALGTNERVAILDARGVVVASTDQEWAEPGAAYTEIEFLPARTATGRAIELRGDTTAFGNDFVLDFEDNTLASSHPLIVDGQLAGVVLLQSDDSVNPENRSFVRAILTLAGANLVALTLLTVPALIVSVPVGIFRARKISQRLEHLSDAATAMATGDMQSRVHVEGTDEVARVGERFNMMVERLDEADKSRRAFVSNVSHELRTPVAILRGNLEQMLSSNDIDPAQLQTMYRETVTLARLIDDLFTLARVEEAVIQVEFAPVDIQECIQQAVESIASLAWEQRKVSVQAAPSAGLPDVLGERVRIQQILNNLLHNALRHTPEGGLIVAGAERAGDAVEISVRDTGFGIAPEDLEHVFDRYRQGERIGRHEGGSGLGLAIVKQLVEAMGGAISVTSVPNQGTGFTFTLPAVATSKSGPDSA